ncbi:molybdopterin oxidoreductase family protein [Ilumatobacter sp.]|uniref:molybdopterin oxidoreductase family protein n=1 Tax=Ilumatobacter sp. TaxID=1967498 RepID=UPI002A252897|nr:molybdopterin oxidoreductase family protein [Ilumatobacter sp.]
MAVIENDPSIEAATRTVGEVGIRTAYRTCPLCEATCGLEITLKSDGVGGKTVQRIRGDKDDVFSKGFICPKGSTLKHLHEDPDRLRVPMAKRDGVHVEVTWEEAWSEIEAGLGGVIERHGRSSLGVYGGNAGAHSLSSMMYLRTLFTGLGTRNRYSASTVDQMPRHVAAGHIFGSPVAVPVPDLDRTEHLLILGANPYVSNGSMCTAPDFPGRIERIRERGGKVVVVDPRRSRTAEEADEWIAIRPGSDALLLAAMCNVLVVENLVNVGPHVAEYLNGLDEFVAAIAPFTPESVVVATDVAATVIRKLARELAAATTASVYGRIGTTATEFGSTATWLIDALNILTGNLDRSGGAMFAMPVAGGATTRGKPGSGRGFEIGRGQTRVSGHPEVMGEYPVGALAEEITTPGEGQLRAMITVGGNPIRSNPNSELLAEAFNDLEFMVSVDLYLNETTRHADVILPSPSQLQRSHYDLLLLQFGVRNVANYSEPVLPLDGQPDEWEVISKLTLVAQGMGVDADPALADHRAIDAMVRSAVRSEHSRLRGRDAEEILAELNSSGRVGPERMLDFMLRSGPFGDGFGAEPEGTSLDDLLRRPHGRDFGALEPRLPDILRTPSGKVELAPAAFINDLDRLAAAVPGFENQGLVLIGRRHLRSNNSWMHNVNVLVKGKPRCTLHVHPDDAALLGLTDGDAATITSRVGSVTAPVEVTDSITPGVVSLPHGWGHNAPGAQMRVAAEHAGVNSNILTDHEAMDPLSGTSVLNGIPVEVAVAS